MRSNSKFKLFLSTFLSASFFMGSTLLGDDPVRELQTRAIQEGTSPAAHWGWKPETYTLWGSHSNRLIPVYTFGTKGAGKGIDLADYKGKNSLYRDADKITELYGQLPKKTLNQNANYLDQTDIYRLQKAAMEAGKKNIFLVVFDGMDWNTTRAAAVYNQQAITYDKGRGTGTFFQDYKANGTSQFGFMVTSPFSDSAKTDVNKQTANVAANSKFGGYDVDRGGKNPWETPSDPEYLVAGPKGSPDLHAYTDSSSSATSMTAGIKTFNGGVNVTPTGEKTTTLAHIAQREGRSDGAVSSVPISHATPAAAYAINVERDDYQDLTRDMIGLPSISHPDEPLPGLDVVIGGGFGAARDKDSAQGTNFIGGNVFLTDEDKSKVNVANGGQYVVAERIEGKDGTDVLMSAAEEAKKSGHRLLGFFGVGQTKGHLPFQTADGDYKTAPGRSKTNEIYTEGDVTENPTLAEMTKAAITVLESNPKGFWLMVEAGDVDWANHDDNIDNSIGAVNSGADAVKVIADWVEANSNWDESLMIVTADHGHYLVLDKPEMLIAK